MNEKPLTYEQIWGEPGRPGTIDDDMIIEEAAAGGETEPSTGVFDGFRCPYCNRPSHECICRIEIEK